MTATRIVVAVLVAGVIATLAAAGGHVLPAPSAHAQGSGTAPVVTVDVPTATGVCRDPQPCLRGVVALGASATASAGRSIVRVEFQRAIAGTGDWIAMGLDEAEPFTASFNTAVVADGLYDFRAVATDSADEVGVSAIARDRLVANRFNPAALVDPGSPLAGTVMLSASARFPVPSILFQYAPNGSEAWTTIETVSEPVGGTTQPTYRVSWATGELPDGSYDVRATPTSALGVELPSVPVRARVIDNTAPSAQLTPPPATLSGVAGLSASAQDAGTGVAAVRFERAPAGSGRWTGLGTRTRAPFDLPVDTRAFADGRYDLRVVATDRAGNTAASPIVAVTVSNPGVVPLGGLAIENLAAPADDIRLLGVVAGSLEGEAWGFGTTTAPPSVAEGELLPYTAPGEQIVLLRYTDSGGWQLADVLRNADGSAYDLRRPGDVGVPTLIGTMAPSGEAWLAFTRSVAGGRRAVRLFHRMPGGRFVHDVAASDSLDELTSQGIGALRITQEPDGEVHGLLTAPGQAGRPVSAPGPNGGPEVEIDGRLDYAVLRAGTWTRRTAPLPATYAARPGDTLRLALADVTDPGAGWAAFTTDDTGTSSPPLMLGRFDGDDWTWHRSGLEALDLTDRFAALPFRVEPLGLRAEGAAVWLRARVQRVRDNASGEVVIRFDGDREVATDSWCGDLPAPSPGCARPFGLATIPDAVFATPEGPVALALPPEGSTSAAAVYRFARGEWTRLAAPGFLGGAGRAVFTGPTEGWLAGTNALGRIAPAPPPDPLARWPQPNRAPLLGVAVPPGGTAEVGTSGALAVGLGGTTLRYDAAAGWLIEAVPARAARLALRGVAFSGPSTAVAVGQAGVILRWDGTGWSEDPQSVTATQAELNAVAFRPSGEGWAVGRYGTILHFDGSTWSEELPPPEDSGLNLSSVTVAGDDVFAVIGGNLIQRSTGGSWRRVAASLLPAEPELIPGDLRVVSGLPDGGLVAAGRSVVLVRERSGARFAYADQPIEGIAVAAGAFRDPGGDVRAFLSVAPPVALTRDVGGFPPGDGVLLRQTGAGWEDLSHGQYAGGFTDSPEDGVVKEDPVLAVAPSPSGDRAWAVGGFAGTVSAGGFGSILPLTARAANWQTSGVWRWDRGGSVAAPNLTQARVELPALPDTVSFAFFSSSVCRVECAATIDAQPDVNLRAAATQIAEFGKQAGGPAFAMLGGNARGRNPLDFANLPGLLAPLAPVPLFAAHGPLDEAQGVSDPSRPWAEAFARAPAPFGPAPAPAGITPLDSRGPTGSVHRHYAFDVRQNGGRLRVIVLDNAAGSLEASSPGQTAWLEETLATASRESAPTIAVAAQALRPGGALDGREVAALLARSGVLAVFTTFATDADDPARPKLNERRVIPDNAEPGQPTLPAYEGASLGYQEIANNGVVWYFVSVDTTRRVVTVQGVPVVESLALKPLLGLSAARSSTLAFEAVGRRPRGSLPRFLGNGTGGIDNYVSIPAPSCSGRPCVLPGYRFESSDPTIGDFVQPSGPGSRVPRLDPTGKPIASPASGLFCAYNTGTTTVSLTTGLLRASLPVTVGAGNIGRPCGTVFRQGVGRVVLVPNRNTVRTQTPPAGAGAPPPPPPAANAPIDAALPAITLPPPPAPAPAAPKPAKPDPPRTPLSPPPAFVPATPAGDPPPTPVPPAPVVAVPPLPPVAQPIPPGGSASAQAAARRKEKAVKHASQSAFSTRPAGVPGADWFYPALGVVSLLTLLLIAGGVRPGPKDRPAALLARSSRAPTRRPTGWPR